MRINFVAGPSAGKSKTAMRLASDLKGENKSVEYTSEYIKSWALLKREPKGFDQCYVFAKQLHAEDVNLQSGVKNIVTDSPIFMQCAYAKKYNFPGWQELKSIARQFELVYPSLTIFLDREGLKFESLGRYHDEQQSREIDQEIKDFLEEEHVPYVSFRTLEYDKILQFVLDNID